METKSRRQEDNKLEISVTLSADEVQVEIDAAYKEAGKNRIPGFRPGKAPRNILENYFGGKEYFQAQATDNLVNSFTPLATDEVQAVPLSGLDFAELDLVTEGEPFSYTYTVEVAPELTLSSYEPVQIELPSAEPTDEELQAQIEALLSYNTTTDEEGNEQTPELTDAWVKETLEFDSVDEFKERLTESLREQKGQDIPRLREIRSQQELLKRLEGDVPESLVQQTEQDNYRDLFQNLQMQHITLDAYLEAYGLTPESFRESMHQQAHESAAMTLSLDALARHLALAVSEEDMQEEFIKSGAPDPQKLIAEWRKKGRLSEIRQGILRMKAADHLFENAEVFEPGTLHPSEDADTAKDKKASKAEDAKKPAKGKGSSSKKSKESEEATESKGKESKEKAPKKQAKTEDASAKKKPAEQSGKEADAKKTTSPKTKSAKVDDKKGKEE